MKKVLFITILLATAIFLMGSLWGWKSDSSPPDNVQPQNMVDIKGDLVKSANIYLEFLADEIKADFQNKGVAGKVNGQDLLKVRKKVLVFAYFSNSISEYLDAKPQVELSADILRIFHLSHYSDGNLYVYRRYYPEFKSLLIKVTGKPDIIIDVQKRWGIIPPILILGFVLFLFFTLFGILVSARQRKTDKKKAQRTLVENLVPSIIVLISTVCLLLIYLGFF